MAPPASRPPSRPSRRSFVEPAATGPERIAKLLARAGVASRREVERMIAEGRVALDGALLESPALTLSSLAGVTVDGKPVAAPEPTRLFLFHKPAGVLTAERDPRGRPTIYDRLPPGLPRLVPVGRLDLNTEGLLLMTTDGEFKRQLELPATGVERAYRARAYGSVTQAQLESLIEGVEVEGVRYGSINANLERRTGANVWVEMILTEGKNREVRRVLEYLGLRVSRLIRTRYGPFVLGDLETGQVGEVRASDLATFRRSLARGKPATEPVRVRPPVPTAPVPASVKPTSVKPAATGRTGASVPSARGRPAPRDRNRVPARGRADMRSEAGAAPTPADGPANARARRAAAFRASRVTDTPAEAPRQAWGKHPMRKPDTERPASDRSKSDRPKTDRLSSERHGSGRAGNERPGNGRPTPDKPPRGPRRPTRRSN